ncbi:MAG: hypothetical protein J6T10_20430 [Methanobrevibacter sp.]|nr:hypothetical protein [Methanobrevibacter sp.]
MKNFRFDYIFDGVALWLASIQAEALLKYIQLGLGILATIISILLSLWTWWKKAKKDGKITEDEVKEAIEIFKKPLDDKNKEE